MQPPDARRVAAWLAEPFIWVAAWIYVAAIMGLFWLKFRSFDVHAPLPTKKGKPHAS